MNKADILVSAVSACAGLATVGFVNTEDQSTAPITLWKAVAKHDATPILKTTSITTLRDTWREWFNRVPIATRAGDLLFSLGGYGSLPWLRVTCATPESLLDVRAASAPDIEFIVTNLSLTSMAAITTEEDDYWIFSATRTDDLWIFDQPPLG